MEKKTNIIMFTAVIVAVTVITLILLLEPNIPLKENNKIRNLNLSKDNFVILDKGYIQFFNENACKKAKLGECDWAGVNPCDSTVYSIVFKLVNLPKEIDTYSLGNINSNLQIKAYSNGEEAGYKNQDGTINKISFSFGGIKGNSQDTPFIYIPLKYTKNNSLVVCFQVYGMQSYRTIEDSSSYNLTSNELCLDSINISALC